MQWLLTLAILLISSGVAAQPKSCLADYTSAQIYWTPSNPSDERVDALLSSRNGQLFTTRVQLVTKITGGELSLSFRFDPNFDGVSLPYNLQGVMILEKGQVVRWWDFTKQCHSPGVSFFPGRMISLPGLKPLGEGWDQLQIMVWGRL
ncbi:MAG: hypothetical protein AB7F86_11480 [Bdellovibrionales bacterium]